ncbi:MAG TPA: hypothetical protein VF715_12875 [Thermoleophilaceae bacterium]
MSTGPVRTIAATAARSFGRRLRARGGRGAAHGPGTPRLREHAEPAPSIPLPVAGDWRDEPEEDGVPEAELDALRGALVRELDRMAADDDCSAAFRRAS